METQQSCSKPNPFVLYLVLISWIKKIPTSCYRYWKSSGEYNDLIKAEQLADNPHQRDGFIKQPLSRPTTPANEWTKKWLTLLRSIKSLLLDSPPPPSPPRPAAVGLIREKEECGTVAAGPWAVANWPMRGSWKRHRRPCWWLCCP